MKQIWIYDIEQYRNFHCCTFQSRDGTIIRQFIIHELQDDRILYKLFLDNEIDGLVGFNNLNYDGVILNYLYEIIDSFTLDEVNLQLYELSNTIINDEVTDEIKRINRIKRWNQLDLYAIYHFSNKARKTSLKGVAIAIKHDDIQDLPYEPDSYITTIEEINNIVYYNFNDVLITNKLFHLTQNEINMRLTFGEKYNIDIINANDPQIGSRLIAKYLCKTLNISYYELSQMRTYRKYIKLEDIILPYIEFKTQEFNNILTTFKQIVVTETKNAFDLSVVVNEVKYVFGTGGIHGCKEPGIYEVDANQLIINVDVQSFYPNIAIQNKFYPQHLTEKFCDIYDHLYQQRLEAKRNGNKYINEGLKKAIVSVFGKSNDIYSFLYDPAFTMKITVNGQLLLLMLAELFILNNIEILQVNTDGVMIRCNRSDEDKIKELCRSWEQLTKLSLEFDYFSKIVSRDVNNYIAVYQQDTIKTKQKGVFLIERELHKDHSMKVVRIAVHDYFVHGIPVETTLYNHTDIYDFCIRYKSIGKWIAEEHYIDGQYEKIKQLNKNVRFFISKNGSSLYKRHKEDNRIIGIQAGKTVTVFNQYVEKPTKEYNIDYSYYIREAYDIIYSINDGQLKLF